MAARTDDVADGKAEKAQLIKESTICCSGRTCPHAEESDESESKVRDEICKQGCAEKAGSRTSRELPNKCRCAPASRLATR